VCALLDGSTLPRATSLVHAAEDSYTASTEDVSAGAIIADGLLLRPGGIVATVLGTAVFVSRCLQYPNESVDKQRKSSLWTQRGIPLYGPLGQIESSKPHALRRQWVPGSRGRRACCCECAQTARGNTLQDREEIRLRDRMRPQ